MKQKGKTKEKTKGYKERVMEPVINENQSFNYSYSAKRQKEVEDIRKKYLPKKEDKLETLKRLDREAEKPGMIASLAVGIIGSLLLGVGMCCTMVWGSSMMVFVLGIIVGIMGIVILSVAYPLYKKVTKKQREKIAGQILALSKELSA